MASTLVHRYLIRTIYIAIDIVIVALAFYCSCRFLPHKLSFDITFTNLFFSSVNPFRSVFYLWGLTLIIQSYTIGLYETRREITEIVEAWHVFKANALSALIVIVAIYVVKIEGFPRTIFATSFMSLFVLLSLWRIIKRSFVDYLVSQGYNNFHVLIIGAGRVGATLATEIRNRPGLGLKIVGFLDDFKSSKQSINRTKIIGKIEDLQRISRREFVSEVYITIHLDEKVLSSILEYCKEQGISVHVVPHGYELIGGQFAKSNIGIIPLLEYSDMQKMHKQFGKRLFDFVGAALAIIVLAPLFLMIAILIKLDSPGPVLYFSQRYGRKGNRFPMFKFRSMVMDAEKALGDLREKNETDGPIFKMKRDPRITKIGRVLRKFSLDELPQLFNVVRGEMSLVGPRPLQISEVQKEDLRQLQRLEVRPGMTGLWQVRGRSDVSFTRLVRWDVWYINNWSFWLDINILFQTIPVVIKGRGAY